MTTANVKLWGKIIGTVVYNNGTITFEYDKKFTNSGIRLAPIYMPPANINYSFPNLINTSFEGLPGLLADSLPDTFGNMLINEYLVRQGRKENSMDPVEKLLYVGTRGPGALEYFPSSDIEAYSGELNIEALSQLATKMLTEKTSMNISTDDELAMQHLIQTGSSAGGSRAKILIALNEREKSIKSGQIYAGKGYTYWILKFDFTQVNNEKILKPNDKEYTKIEYAYHLMAKQAGIDMSECRLYEDNGCSHFITKRFDRGDDGEKYFMQSLAATGHYDYNMPGTCGFEQMAMLMDQMNLPQNQKEQAFRRIVFNELSKNYDDHVKNFAFLMDQKGNWSISPAFDITYSYQPEHRFIGHHQILINNKNDNLTIDDFIKCGKSFNLKERNIRNMIEEISEVIKLWPAFAQKAHISEQRMEQVKQDHNSMILRNTQSKQPQNNVDIRKKLSLPKENLLKSNNNHDIQQNKNLHSDDWKGVD